MDFWIILAGIAGALWGVERYFDRQFTDIKSRLYDIEEKLNKR